MKIVEVRCLYCNKVFRQPFPTPLRYAPNQTSVMMPDWSVIKLDDIIQNLADAEQRIEELENRIASLTAERVGVCAWQPDEGFDYTCINTACHQSYVFEDGYEDGDHTYCAHCGRKIRFNPNPEPQEGKE